MAAAVIEIRVMDHAPCIGQAVSYNGGYFVVRSVLLVGRCYHVEIVSITANEARAIAGNLNFVPSLNRYPQAG